MQALSQKAVSVQVEVDFQVSARHGVTVFLGWLEAPGLDGFNGFFIQSHAQRGDHADIVGSPFASTITPRTQVP